MYMNRFQQGDKVQYAGNKLSKELAGKLGIIHARVGNSERGVVVDFGNDSYILDEQDHLAKFQLKEAQIRSDDSKVEKKPTGPEVTRRKSRKNVDQE
jgi:hypothetical protein